MKCKLNVVKLGSSDKHVIKNANNITVCKFNTLVNTVLSTANLTFAIKRIDASGNARGTVYSLIGNSPIGAIVYLSDNPRLVTDYNVMYPLPDVAGELRVILRSILLNHY